MKGFYYNESNFNNLYNEVAIILSEASTTEGWLEDLYVSDRYNTTRAVEKYTTNILLNKLNPSNVNTIKVDNILDNRILNLEPLNEDCTINDKLSLLNVVKKSAATEAVLLDFINNVETIDTLKYLKENYTDKDFRCNVDINDSSIMKILVTIESLNMVVRKQGVESETVKCIQENINATLYMNKDVIRFENMSVDFSFSLLKNKPINEINPNDIDRIFECINRILNDKDDEMIEYVTDQLKYTNKLIENYKLSPVTESVEYDDYTKAVNKFNYLVEHIFLDEDSNVSEVIDLYELTEALCEYESTMEVSSRIITKGTEKTTKAIGNASARGAGMSSVKSNVGRVKRGARIVEDRASEAVNRKIDDIINFTRSRNREKIITGSNTIKLSRDLKTLITAAIIAILGPGAAMKLGGMGMKGVKIAASTAGLLGGIKILIGIMAVKAMNKKTKESERKKILVELETELKIVKEKIEDAKGDNAKEKKYQLMRIEANLEKEIFRIKHNMKPY